MINKNIRNPYWEHSAQLQNISSENFYCNQNDFLSEFQEERIWLHFTIFVMMTTDNYYIF